jgi:integrase
LNINRNPFTWEEEDHFEEIFLRHHPQFYPLIVCGFRTGLRIGKLLALKWEYIDFFNRTIHVQRNITRRNITTPKNKSSIRLVRLTAYLIEVLQDQMKKAKEAKQRMVGIVFLNGLSSIQIAVI